MLTMGFSSLRKEFYLQTNEISRCCYGYIEFFGSFHHFCEIDKALVWWKTVSVSNSKLFSRTQLVYSFVSFTSFLRYNFRHFLMENFKSFFHCFHLKSHIFKSLVFHFKLYWSFTFKILRISMISKQIEMKHLPEISFVKALLKRNVDFLSAFRQFTNLILSCFKLSHVVRRNFSLAWLHLATNLIKSLNEKNHSDNF